MCAGCKPATTFKVALSKDFFSRSNWLWMYDRRCYVTKNVTFSMGNFVSGSLDRLLIFTRIRKLFKIIHKSYRETLKNDKLGLSTSNTNKFCDRRHEMVKSTWGQNFPSTFQDSITHIQSYIMYKKLSTNHTVKL